MNNTQAFAALRSKVCAAINAMPGTPRWVVIDVLEGLAKQYQEMDDRARGREKANG